MTEEAKPIALSGTRASRRALTPMDMLNRAVEQGANMDVLEKLMALQERWEASQARKAFDAAISAAKAEIPILLKNKLVDFVGQTGKRTTYKHETLDQVIDTIQPVLSRHGLDQRFRTESAPGFLTVICRISHRDGHSEENSLTAPVDTSGNKNPIQAIGSAQTYLQRYTLKSALGLAAAEDEDGKVAGERQTITEEQTRDLQDRLEAVKANLSAFCDYVGVLTIADIPAEKYEAVERAVRVKEKQAKAKQETADAS